MPKSSQSQQLADIIGQFESHKLDALLVSHLPNIRYLTGFTGSNALLLITSKRSTLFTDSRYTTQAANQYSGPMIIVHGPLYVRALQAAKGQRLQRIGLEGNHTTLNQYQAMQDKLWLGATLTAVPSLVEQLRMVKTEAEINAIRHSVKVNSQAYERACRRLKPHMTESQAAAELDYQMRRLGADASAFSTIVAAGPHAALPHAQPGIEPVGLNRLLLIDMGAACHGYMSDMTRMVCFGKPSRRMQFIHNAVLEAQQAALAAVKPGVTAHSVDRKARAVLAQHGLQEQFIHSTGHGLGLEIHELPRLGKGDRTELVAGMVITIEPGVYLTGELGVRIEDTVVVTESGCDILTPTSKELRVL